MASMQSVCEQLRKQVGEIKIDVIQSDGYIIRKLCKGGKTFLLGSYQTAEKDNDVQYTVDIIDVIYEASSSSDLLALEYLAKINAANKNSFSTRMINKGRICDFTVVILDGTHDVQRLMWAVNESLGVKQPHRNVRDLEAEVIAVLSESSNIKPQLTERTADKVQWRMQITDEIFFDCVLRNDAKGHAKLDVSVPVQEEFFTRHAISRLLTGRFDYNIYALRENQELKRDSEAMTRDMGARLRSAAEFNTMASITGGGRMYVVDEENAVAMNSISLDTPLNSTLTSLHSRLISNAKVHCFHAPEISPRLFQEPVLSGLGRAAGVVAMGLFGAFMGR